MRKQTTIVVALLLTWLVGPTTAEEERLWLETGETREGRLEPVIQAPVPPQELSEIDAATIEQLQQRWERLRAKTSRAVPPLKYLVPAGGEALIPRVPPTEISSILGADDFVLAKNTTPTDAVPGGFSSTVNEPSVVSADDHVFYSGNWYAVTSSNGGDTFNFINPFTGPFPPPPSGGFCCDQVTAYDHDSDAILYLQQYLNDASTGVHRINVDQGSDGVFDCFYDITPQIMGFDGSAWNDFPDLAIGDNFVYHSANVFDTTTFAFEGAYVVRYDLAEMSSCGSVPFAVYSDTSGFFSFKLTRGATDVMYFADHISTASMRIWSWPEASGAPTAFDRAVTAWSNNTRVCPGPDGDWCGFIDRRMAGAWVADGIVGFMWMPSQGGSFDYPYTRIARFSTAGLGLVSEPIIWNPGFAWVYPSVAVNELQDLGGTIMAGGGALHPACIAWIADDTNGDTLAPLENQVSLFGTTSPATNRSGDYNSTAAHYPNGLLWSGACFAYLSPDEGTAKYILFGREKHLGAIFVDGFESGDTSAWSNSVP